MLGYQLSIVLVRSDHIDVQGGGGLPYGHRTYDVVRLEAGEHQDGNIHRPDYFRERLEGVYHQLGRRRTSSLVGRIELVPEGPSRRVEGHGDMAGLLFINQFQQVFRESEKDGSIHSLGINHRPAQESIVHLEYQRVPVYEEKLVHNCQRYENFPYYVHSLRNSAECPYSIL